MGLVVHEDDSSYSVFLQEWIVKHGTQKQVLYVKTINTLINMLNPMFLNSCYPETVTESINSEQV